MSYDVGGGIEWGGVSMLKYIVQRWPMVVVGGKTW